MQKIKEITGVLLIPGEEATLCTIENTTSAIRKLLNIPFQADYFFKENNVCILRQEAESKNRLPFNRAITNVDGVYDFFMKNDVITAINGPAFIVGKNGDTYCSLDKESAKKYLDRFHYPERICLIKGIPFVLKDTEDPINILSTAGPCSA